MQDDYNPNSVNAVLSRIETKLNQSLEKQDEHSRSIDKLWAALSRLDMRVAVISAGVALLAFAIKLLFPLIFKL